jgi:hypothetical protein
MRRAANSLDARDFRDARGPTGFSVRRRASSPATRPTCSLASFGTQSSTRGNSFDVPEWRRSAQEQVIRHIPAERLAVELRRRGWTVVEPESR